MLVSVPVCVQCENFHTIPYQMVHGGGTDLVSTYEFPMLAQISNQIKVFIFGGEVTLDQLLPKSAKFPLGEGYSGPTF